MIKKILIVTCGSFTPMVLFFILFARISRITYFSDVIALELFVMCLTVAILMSVSDRIEAYFDVSAIWMDALIRVFICYFVVFIQGSLFGMFPFSWISFTYITPVLIPGFFVAYGISYLTCIEYSKAINESINRKRKK